MTTQLALGATPAVKAAPVEVRLNMLSLRNFKGIRDCALEPFGADISIYGANATGKTTLADAWSWLLYGKDSLGSAAFEVKPLGATAPQVEVEAVVSVQRGEEKCRQVTLKRTLTEKWAKKRGSAEKEFGGNVTTYSVDGVPRNESEWRGIVAELTGAVDPRLLTDPRYFAADLHWQKRRELLLSVCGDISDADVIAAEPALAALPGILGQKSMDEHKKVITARRAAINKELEGLPNRLDEKRRDMAKLPLLPDGVDEAETKAALAAAIADRDKLQAMIARAEAGGKAGQLTARLLQVETEMARLENEANRAYERRVVELTAAESQAVAKRRETERAIETLGLNIRNVEVEVERLVEQKGKLLKDYHTLREKPLPDVSVAGVCPACQQSLPEEQVEAAREQAIAQANRARSEALESIVSQGKALASNITAREAILADRRAEQAQLQASLEAHAAAITAAQQALQQHRATPPALSPHYAPYQADRDRLQKEIAALGAGGKPDMTVQKMDLATVQRNIAVYEGHLATMTRIAEIEARVAQLQDEQKALGREYEQIARELDLCERFVRTKVTLLEKSINSRFQLATFRLFVEQVNGGLEERCDVSVNGVPYGSLNNAARICAGLDVIDVLSQHFGRWLPIIVDNSEAVDVLPPTRSQQIRLYVSAGDKALRVEKGVA